MSEHTKYKYSKTTDRIVGVIANLRESGKGTAGTKKAVDDILEDTFGGLLAACEVLQKDVHKRYCDPHPMGQSELCKIAKAAIDKA